MAGSSSTTITMAWRSAGGVRGAATRVTATAPPAWGRRARTVVPCPGVDAIDTRPPALITMPYTVDSPSPVPRPRGLVVKKGSNARDRVASSIPIPVSATSSAAQRVMGTWSAVIASPGAAGTVSTRTVS